MTILNMDTLQNVSNVKKQVYCLYTVYELKTWFPSKNKFEYWRSTYRLSVDSKALKYELL
jgi:hypothetical protein